MYSIATISLVCIIGKKLIYYRERERERGT